VGFRLNSRRTFSKAVRQSSDSQIILASGIHDLSEVSWQLWLANHGETYQRRVKDRLFNGYNLVLQACDLRVGIAAPNGVRDYFHIQDLIQHCGPYVGRALGAAKSSRRSELMYH
jgi:hypothetical protein